MNIGAYSSLILPAVIVVVVLFVLIKVINTIVKIVALLLLVAAIGGGYLMYNRISALERAAEKAAQPVTRGVMPQAALQGIVAQAADQAITTVGLNPQYLRINVTCGTPTQLHLRYNDNGFMFGLLSHQTFTVPLVAGLRC